MRFTDKVCVVTGGGSGIGKAACLQLAREGGKVLVADINSDGGRATVQEITASGGAAVFAQTDVSVSEQVQAAVKMAVDTWGKIDVVVNDAAMMTFTPIIDLPDAQFDKVIAVNLRSVFLFCKYSVPHMGPGAAIVNISSVHAHETTKNVVPYAASKGAMEAFARGLSIELADRQIRVNCVAPGAVDTPLLRSNPDLTDGVEKLTGAVGKPEDLAQAICFMASDEARFVNGTTLVVDGGRLDNL